MRAQIVTGKALPDCLKNKTFIHPQDGLHHDNTSDGFKLPGIIDIHFHGAYGWDFVFGNPEKIGEMLDKLLAHGITGLFPTLITCPEDQRRQALRDIATAVKKRDNMLPVIHGIHLEGPFLAESKRGSHPAECLQAPSMKLLQQWQEDAEGLIKLITIAPELPGAIDFIREASKAGVTVSLGHSAADWDTTMRAIEAGARHVTHLFNAMPALHHREPNLLSCVLANRNLSIELIGDCEHVAPEIVRLVFGIYENTQIIITSDAVAPTGLADGEYQMYNNTLVKTGGRCCIKHGKLFGGATLLNECLVRLSAKAGISWGLLCTSVWRNPCELLHIDPPDTEVFYDNSMKWLASRFKQTWFCRSQ
jgi:N-acetylglucosamine-6-phosphate deacetylase